MRDTSSIGFRFRYVRQTGITKNILPRYGMVRREGLLLNQNTIFYRDIHKVSLHGKKMVISLLPYPTVAKEITENIFFGHASLVLKVSSYPQDVKAAIDRKLSGFRLKDRRDSLTKEELTYRFRTVNCPNCKAHLDLTDKKDTRFIHCSYCDTISDRNGAIIPGRNDYKICPECSYFGKIRNTFRLDFFFLYKDYKFNFQKYYCCDTCSERFFKATVFKNLTLIFGFIIVGIEKLRTKRNRNPAYPELTEASLFIQDGNFEEGDILYGSLITKHIDHPGLYFNYGLSYFAAEDMRKAYFYFNKGLAGCSNYQPILDFLEKHKEVEVS